MDSFKSFAVTLFAIATLLFCVYVYYVRFRDWLLKHRLLRNNKKLFYRVLSRPKGKYRNAWYLKAWVALEHDQLIEFVRTSDLQVMLNPFPEGTELIGKPEFITLLESFPGLEISQLLIKHGKLEVIAMFKQGGESDLLLKNFPLKIEEWFEEAIALLQKYPGKKRRSFLINLDRYTDLLLRFAWVLLPVSYLTRPLFRHPALLRFLADNYKNLVYGYLLGMILIFICYFYSKKSLALRSFSKLFIIIFIYVLMNLLYSSLKS